MATKKNTVYIVTVTDSEGNVTSKTMVETNLTANAFKTMLLEDNNISVQKAEGPQITAAFQEGVPHKYLLEVEEEVADVSLESSDEPGGNLAEYDDEDEEAA